MSAPTVPSWDRLARAAAAAGETSSEAPRVELLEVQVAGDPYALPIDRVREIVRLRPITPMPRVPALVLGVVSLRGQVVQVVDLGQRLGSAPTEASPRARIVVLQGDDPSVVALRVDAVTEVIRVPEETLQEPPGDAADCVRAICRRGTRFVSVLDPDLVIQRVGS